MRALLCKLTIGLIGLACLALSIVGCRACCDFLGFDAPPIHDSRRDTGTRLR